MKSQNLKILFLGPPTSGKGTQSEIVANKINLTHISTGEIFRENIRKKTKLGLEVKSIIEQGRLVDDEITNNLLADKLKEIDGGFILDGYPRNMIQAQALGDIVDITHVFYIEIHDAEVIARAVSRRICNSCGKFHNISSMRAAGKDTCVECGGKLELREDDNVRVVHERLKEYHEKTEPMIEFYRKQKVLVEIDGSKSIELVSQKILDEIKKDD